MILEKEICVTVDFLFCFLKSCSSLQSPLTVKVKTRIMNYKIDIGLDSMIIAKNDEDKRSRVWNYVTGITTVLIIIVAGYFIYQGFFGNPLEGKWKHDESDMILEVDDHNEAELDWKNLIDGKDVEVELGYTLDIKAKQITFTVKQEELDETAKELGDNVTATEVEQAINSVLTTFNYSVDGTKLTLTEWDYGDQMIFEKAGK